MKRNMKIILIIVLIFVNFLSLIACDMFMLQAIDDHPFFTNSSLSGDFDDPYDFFENFKTLANSTSGNRDGYGVIAYNFDSNYVNRDLRWYKTGIGNFFDENNIDEPLYEAINYLYDNDAIERVLVHARSGTGGNGSHPFIFNVGDRSYSFMHNGFISSSVKRDIITFLGDEWFATYPSQWEGNPDDVYSFIDSELLFHYLMFYIMQTPEDLPLAFRRAFTNKKVSNTDMEYNIKFNNNAIINFLLSDGDATYLYRSSRLLSTSYNLSYQVFPSNFIAVKTGSNLANQVSQNTLLKLSLSGEVDSLSIDSPLNTHFIKTYVDKLTENEFKLSWQIESNPNIYKFNIYRGSVKNFSSAQSIVSVSLTTPNQSSFSIIDNYSSLSEHFYWIEIIYHDNTSEITTLISSLENDNEEPENPTIIDDILLYPNPFADMLNIAIDSKLEYQIKIYNLKGQIIKSLYYDPLSPQLIKWEPLINNDTLLPNGIYIIKFISKNSNIVKKVMKIN